MAEEIEYTDIFYLEEVDEENRENIEEYQIEESNNQVVSEEEPEEPEIKFFTSSKGTIRLFYNSQLYNHEKSSGNSDYYKCANKENGCKSRIIVRNEKNGDRVVFPPKINHSHSVKVLKSSAEVSLSSFREKAIADGSRPCQLIQDFRAEDENKFLNVKLPSDLALRKRILRARKKNENAMPPEPLNLIFDYDRDFCTLDNEFIVLNDWTSPDSTQRITLFSTARLFNYLCDATVWLSDGTFETCPKNFYQLFILHGNLHGDLYVCYPLLFVLLSGKSTDLYKKMLDMVSQVAQARGKQIQFTQALFDFEKAIANAFRTKFPNVNYTGCLFHLDQIIIKQVKAQKFYSRYLRNHAFHTDIACLMALAFIPADEILLFFEDLYPELSIEAKRIATWFKHNYIQQDDGRRSRYSPEFWSVYNNFINGYPTTQNWAESFHHRVHAVLNTEHESLYKFIGFLKKEFSSITTSMDKYFCGKPQKHRVPGYERYENSIKSVLERRNGILRIDTLRALASVKDDLRF